MYWDESSQWRENFLLFVLHNKLTDLCTIILQATDYFGPWNKGPVISSVLFPAWKDRVLENHPFRLRLLYGLMVDPSAKTSSFFRRFETAASESVSAQISLHSKDPCSIKPTCLLSARLFLLLYFSAQNQRR